MNEVYLIYWDYITFDNKCYSDGCSLHIDNKSAKNYLDSVYSNFCDKSIDINVAIDDILIVYVSDYVYSLLLNKYKSIRLSEIEFNNMCNMNDIILDY